MRLYIRKAWKQDPGVTGAADANLKDFTDILASQHKGNMQHVGTYHFRERSTGRKYSIIHHQESSNYGDEPIMRNHYTVVSHPFEDQTPLDGLTAQAHELAADAVRPYTLGSGKINDSGKQKLADGGWNKEYRSQAHVVSHIISSGDNDSGLAEAKRKMVASHRTAVTSLASGEAQEAELQAARDERKLQDSGVAEAQALKDASTRRSEAWAGRRKALDAQQTARNRMQKLHTPPETKKSLFIAL